MIHAHIVLHCRHIWNRGSWNHTLFYAGDMFDMPTASFLHRLEVHYGGAHVGSKYHCWIQSAYRPLQPRCQATSSGGSYLLEKLRPQMKHLWRRKLVCVTRWRLRCSLRRKGLRQSVSVQTKGPDETGARREGANAIVFLDKSEQVDQGDQGDHGWINDRGTSRVWRELGDGEGKEKPRN